MLFRARTHKHTLMSLCFGAPMYLDAIVPTEPVVGPRPGVKAINNPREKFLGIKYVRLVVLQAHFFAGTHTARTHTLVGVKIDRNLVSLGESSPVIAVKMFQMLATYTRCARSVIRAVGVAGIKDAYRHSEIRRFQIS